MEAISHAGAAVGILSDGGVVLAAEKRIASKLLEPGNKSDKMFRVDDHIAVAVAGITADANILINQLRLSSQQYTFQYQQPEPVEELVRDICDLKQGYTQYGGMHTESTSPTRVIPSSSSSSCSLLLLSVTLCLLQVSRDEINIVRRALARDRSSSVERPCIDDDRVS